MHNGIFDSATSDYLFPKAHIWYTFKWHIAEEVNYLRHKLDAWGCTLCFPIHDGCAVCSKHLSDVFLQKSKVESSLSDVVS